MRNILVVAFILFSSILHAYTITVYTDEPSGAKANEVIESFRNTYPFNQYDIRLNVQVVSPNRLNCGPQHGIDRLIGCDTGAIASEAARRRIDQVIIVKHSNVYGGSGGAIPVMTTSSPTSTAIHEYLHTLGLCDEYEYSREEANYYCAAGGPNLALIQPDPNGYSSDQQARSRHMRQIPWASSILPTTPITSLPNLGTGNVNHDMYAVNNSTSRPSHVATAIGLYRARTCNNAVPVKTSWQPGREASIMEFLDAGLGRGNEEIVDKILQSKGIRRLASPPPPPPISVIDSNRSDKLIFNPSSKDDLNSGAKTK